MKNMKRILKSLMRIDNMVDEVKVKKKQIEKEVVEVTVEMDKQFFDNMMKSKADVAEKRGYDVTIGEYIVEAMDDMVRMIDDLSKKVNALGAQVQYQQGMPVVKENEQEPEPGTHVTEEPAPEGMYAKTTNKELKDPMFG
jgi:hypothetical protein